MLHIAYGLLLLVSWTFVNGDPETLARCRVTCLNRFLKKRERSNDNACFEESKECGTCWDVCGRLFQSYTVWKRVCDHRCMKGCRTACRFRRNIPVATKHQTKWRFRHRPTVISDPLELIIDWSRPQPDNLNKAARRRKFVYSLLTKELPSGSKYHSNDWKLELQTASTRIYFDINELPRNAELWLHATDAEGTVANVTFDTTGVISTDDMNIPPYGTSELKQGLTQTQRLDGDDGNHMNLTVNVSQQNKSIVAILLWNNPPVPDDDLYVYNIHWFQMREACNIIGEDYFNSKEYNSDVQPTYSLPKLRYNTMYEVKIKLKTAAKYHSGMLSFRTPECHEPENHCQTCNDIPPNHPHNGEYAEQEPNDPLKWYLNVSSITHDPATNFLHVVIAWPNAPFNTTAVSYEIRWEKLTLGSQQTREKMAAAGTRPTNETSVMLKFEANNIYRVVTAAYYNTSDGQIETFESEALEINTSKLEKMLPLTQQPQKVLEERPNNFTNFDGIVIGSSCVITVILLGLLILFIYKKRQSFKDIIITKTMVAKSNSYKSNVGCKVDYSNQLMVINDEWELDSKQLKFSTPLGQGAFGKVVTGYYQEQKVAIKVVRDSAPLFYKEDLIEEINLMKRIGSHPNIIALIGACTVSEPISLVIEYAPYGNLQTFLKKCRLEGDLRRMGNGVSEIAYSMVDGQGRIDNGIVTPADMLSFARQVAMAMEYLSAKKYVHRDLAARNVLLGYDKVVKLCDFGLSRDIYNDNFYQKLTNGKLPLKWMAIESLRDRVFTTYSDVWSFGILLWEIVTMGASPYPHIALSDLYCVLSNGYRMEKPSNCSNEIYNVMRNCWIEPPKDRPDFTEIRMCLEDLLTTDKNYLQLENIDVPLNSSETSSPPLTPLSAEFSSATPLAAARVPDAVFFPRDAMTVNVCVHDKDACPDPKNADQTSRAPEQ